MNSCLRFGVLHHFVWLVNLTPLRDATLSHQISASHKARNKQGRSRAFTVRCASSDLVNPFAKPSSSPFEDNANKIYIPLIYAALNRSTVHSLLIKTNNNYWKYNKQHQIKPHNKSNSTNDPQGSTKAHSPKSDHRLIRTPLSTKYMITYAMVLLTLV